MRYTESRGYHLSIPTASMSDVPVADCCQVVPHAKNTTFSTEAMMSINERHKVRALCTCLGHANDARKAQEARKDVYIMSNEVGKQARGPGANAAKRYCDTRRVGVRGLLYRSCKPCSLTCASTLRA